MSAQARRRDEALGRSLVEQGALSREDLAARLSEVDALRRRGSSANLAGLLLERREVSPAALDRGAQSLASASLEAAPRARLGPYQLTRRLGAGGMGEVYAARHVETGAVHALKTIRPGLLAGIAPEERARFQAEAELLARLDHPHVVRVHAADLQGEAPYLATELLEGGSLAERLREGELAPTEVLRIGRALADALVHCHAQGVLHRDLKPANVLLDRAGQPKLVDFGLALATDTSQRMTETGAVLGTPGSMSPEQATGSGEADARTDVYGLGALLFELLCRRPPFRGAGLFAVLDQVVHAPPPRPSSLRPELSPAWDAPLLRALAKQPHERFQSASELHAALGSLSEGGGARLAPRALAASALAAALLVGALAASRPDPDPTGATPRARAEATPRATESAALDPSDDLPRGPSVQRLEAIRAFLTRSADHPAAERLRAELSAPLCEWQSEGGFHARFLVGGEIAFTRVVPRRGLKLWTAPIGTRLEPRAAGEDHSQTSAGFGVSPSGRRWGLARRDGLLVGGRSDPQRARVELGWSASALAFAGDDVVYVGGFESGHLARVDLKQGSAEPLPPLPREEAIRGLHVDAQERWLVARCANAPHVALRGASGWGEAQPLDHQALAIALHPGGHEFAIGDAYGGLQRFSLPSLEPLGLLADPEVSDIALRRGHATRVVALRYGPRGERLFSASGRRGDTTKRCDLRAWDLASEELLGAWASADGAYRRLDISPDGELLLLLAEDGRLQVWALSQLLPP